MIATTICTLTIINDRQGEYEDDFLHRRASGKHVSGPLGVNPLARDVVTLLDRWVATYTHCRRDELMVLGKALYEIAFGRDVGPQNKAPLRTAFEETLESCRREHRAIRLRLVLHQDARQLATYPWEFLYFDDPDGGNGFFLAGEDTMLTLTRYVPNSDTWDDAPEDEEDGRLRILVVESTPKIPDMTDLAVGKFVEHLLELDQSRFKTVSTKSPDKITLSKLIEEERPHVIHFIGHGKDGQLALRKDDETLATEREEFEDARAMGQHPQPISEAAWIDARTASGVFKAGLDRPNAPQRLIFLHACEGATAEENRRILGTFGDVARTLAGGQRITGVIAMQYTIGVDEADLFARAFYGAISDGRRVDEAVRVAREELAQTPIRGMQQSWDSRGFGAPVSYLRREEALISRPIARPWTRESSDGRTTGPTGGASKEFCPNPRCLQGTVLRTSKPAKCRLCQELFSECPRCHGLVVPKVGYGCRDCPYVFGEQAASQNVGVVLRQAPGGESITAESSSVPVHGGITVVGFEAGDRRDPSPRYADVSSVGGASQSLAAGSRGIPASGKSRDDFSSDQRPVWEQHGLEGTDGVDPS